MGHRTLREEQFRGAIRSALPKRLYARGARLYDAACCARRLGWRQYRRIRKAGEPCPAHAHTVESFALPRLAYPVHVRRGTTDARTILQTFGREVFARWMPDWPVGFIVDAGANIGDTTAWFASRFPDAVVVAVEPDPASVQVLRLNVAPYGSRVRVMEGALWPTAAPLRLVRSSREDASAATTWTDADGPVCRSITVDDILDAVDGAMIDIFKCDIEGAEETLFADDCPWLDCVRSLYVEIHTKTADVVMRAMAQHGFRVQRYREVLMCVRSND